MKRKVVITRKKPIIGEKIHTGWIYKCGTYIKASTDIVSSVRLCVNFLDKGFISYDVKCNDGRLYKVIYLESDLIAAKGKNYEKKVIRGTGFNAQTQVITHFVSCHPKKMKLLSTDFCTSSLFICTTNKGNEILILECY